MKAVDAVLLDLLKKSTQFVVPIYQRVYSWNESECQRLWDDIMYAGGHDAMGAHFTGSIVYVERDEGTRTSDEPDLLIDGQQRVTTVLLLLAALAAHLETLPPEKREPVEGFSPAKIRNRYLTNSDEDGDRFYKLILSKSDREVLKSIIGGTPTALDSPSKVLRNYGYLQDKLNEPATSLERLCLGLRKLVVVDVRLTRGSDNPQLVFETMNSTGKRLTQADLIRNYVLMDLPPSQQNRLYEGYWSKMEATFSGANEPRFDEFVRHFLTLKTGDIPRLDDIYDAFKAHAEELRSTGLPQNQLVQDLYQYAMRFSAMALGKETHHQLRDRFRDLEQLKATVVYPFLLRAYTDYETGVISADELGQILDMVLAYLFRRAACQIPTNSLNKTFASLASAIDTNDYVNSLAARFLLLPSYTRFPTDEEFATALTTGDLYRFKRASYMFRKLENQGRKEPVSTADYTIEHILPQNENLSTQWQQDLGPDWKSIQEKYLHTLGNLTLTGYNPEYSDRPFQEKRDMAGGFRESPLRLNQGVGQLTIWGPEQIEQRAAALANACVQLWKRPQLPQQTLALHAARYRSRQGFDWTLTHQILEQIPVGCWTGYYYVAEAVGTSAQAVANHVAKCPLCTAPYRVLRWDGRIADAFAWSDPQDRRDPKEVLEAEGIRFTNGVADPEQKLNAEDLLALIED